MWAPRLADSWGLEWAPARRQETDKVLSLSHSRYGRIEGSKTSENIFAKTRCEFLPVLKLAWAEAKEHW